MGLAILVLSADGLALARRLVAVREGPSAIFGPACVVGSCGGPAGPDGSAAGGTFPAGEPGVFGWSGPLRRALPAIWADHDAIVAVMALGIVVRLVGPLAADKRRDPAVVAVDEAGRFAISVLGGHGAGANDLAREVAEALGALPVITTASDARGLPAVDQVGRDLGWAIERAENLTRVAAAVVRGEVVAVYQDAGPPDWWRRFGPWPDHFRRLRSWEDLGPLRAAAVLVISDCIEPADLPADHTLVYRPPTLVVGIGCRRGTSEATIAAFVAEVLARQCLATASLAAVATVSLKADESGLVAFAAGRGLPLLAFPPETLSDVPGVETPSDQVRARIGIPAVAEPAALRAAGASRLLIPKQKGPGVTVAIARRPEGFPLTGREVR
jgi:cobalt-precorrin 5A hydrolase